MLKSHRFRTTVLGLTALIGLGAGGLVPGAVAAEVRKSENDSRVYRSVTLENSLRVLLVSDAKVDKSAASLDVYVGSGADPVDRPGLAHFLEHMLFLGTKKYPEAGEYQAFITANGGRHNAYTSSEHTNYFFDIESGSFAEALDRFGQFFTAPLFSDEYVQREKHAVHSEYQASLKSDGRRIWEARQAAFNPQHPAAKFSVGSLETLADRESASIRAELLAFYERYYSANLMALTVISPATVDEQERLVRSIFSAVDNRDAALPTVATPLFTPGTLPARLDVIPIKDTRRVSLVFPIPALHPHYRSKPTGYLANLIGHEGKGSLLSFLLAKGWADGLSAGAGRAARDSATFEIGITLTREGMTNLDNVVESVFSYLALLRSTKPERWRFDEQARIADIGFRYKEFGAPIHYATRLSSVQHVYPLEDLLYGGYRMDKFDPDLITDYLERLRPDNVLMIVTTKDAVTDTRSKYFGTEYRLAPLPQSTLAKWQKPAAQPDLTLAEPNVFVPTTLELKTLPGQPAPRKLVEEPGLTLWYRPDDTFGVPKANYFVSVRSALANASPAANVMLKLYLRAVNESLKEYAYPVQLAGLGYDLYPHMRGFTVRISGYDPKQPELLERVIASLRDYELTPTRFADYVDDMGRQLDNRAKDRPSHQASRRVTNLLMKPRWTAREQRQALGQVTREGVKAFANDLLKNLEIVALAHGNLTAEDALKLTAIVRQALRDSAEV
ncbi:MAG: insulinase family protein, partial [Gammaproteobacteria bacterium]|nr:insulinase family protein [Gammaproteobacteria bacterium]